MTNDEYKQAVIRIIRKDSVSPEVLEAAAQAVLQELW